MSDDQILSQIKKVVRKQYPFARIYLYGSRSKGTAKLHSDWDILILLDGTKISPEAEQAVTHPLYDLEFETGEIISPLVYSEDEWEKKYPVTPFYQNIMREGRLL